MNEYRILPLPYRGYCRKPSGILTLTVLVLLVSTVHGQTTSAVPASPVPQSSPVPQATPVLQNTPAAAPVPLPQTTAGAKAKTPTLVVNSDEVSIDLVVHDKKRKLVLNLQPSDIVVTDNGTPVSLHDLHLVSGKSTKGHLITLVFDPMTGAAAVNAQEIANKLLRMLPPTGFKVAVMSMGSRLRLIQSFTGDTELTAKAIRLATDEGEGQRGPAIAASEKNLVAISNTGIDSSSKMADVQERDRSKTLLSAIQGSQRITQDQHTRPALAGLLALARSQQSLEERKSVVYFAINGQMDSDALQMVRAIAGAANRSNVSMYTVDMTGIGAGTRDQLMAMTAMGPLSGINPTVPTTSPFAALLGGKAAIEAPKVQTEDPAGAGAGLEVGLDTMAWEGDGGGGNGAANSSPLVRLAANTGGAYIDGQDSVKKPLAQMLTDMTTYYEATYTPPPQDHDGSFRTIHVKPVRTGLSVRSKTGYFSLASNGGEGVRPFEAPLIKMLSDSQLPADLKFHASVVQLGNLAGANTNSLVVEVPVSELETREDPNTNLYSAHLSIVAQIKDNNGVVVQRFGEDIPRHGALQAIDQAKLETVTLQRHFIAVPGSYTLETAVMDRINQVAGAQRLPFTIPAPATGLSISDLVLVRRMDNLRSEADADEPLRFENGKVTPNLSGQVPHEAKSVSLFLILHPDLSAKELPTLEMEVLKDGLPAGHVSLPIHPKAGADAVPYLANLETGSLTPGFYDLKARMTQGTAKVDREISFTVEGTPNAGIAATTASDADAKTVSPATAPANPNQLVISVPDKAVPPPTPEEVQSILSDARQRAVDYSAGLPNFICAEVTTRRIDPSGSGRWKTKDTVLELLKYHNNTETRTMLAVDGKAPAGDRESMKGSFSSGEFGGVLSAVFELSSKANLQWKEVDTLGSGTVQVFDYGVARANSDFKVTSPDNTQITVGFHGQVFIDGATRSVRRITLVADDLPQTFYIHATSIAVDYDYVVINGHDYLMPVAGEVFVKKGRRQAALNQLQFRDYRRLGSTIKILGFTPVEAQ